MCGRCFAICFLNGHRDIVNIKNVHYIPEMCANLLSIPRIVLQGLEAVFNASGCKIYNKKREIVATGSFVNNMFKLDIDSNSEFACLSKTDGVLWHRRFCHSSNIGRYLTDSSERENMKKCEICLKGKQTRLPFDVNGTRAKSILDIVHSDVCGPMPTKSLGGAHFFVTFIDDYSRKVFVKVIKKKSDVFDCFVDFKNLVEKQSAKKIKILRSDNGGEYCSNVFESFLKKHGIMHQKSTYYTPQQNGLAERFNRTIMEKVRCMLFDSKLSKVFLG